MSVRHDWTKLRDGFETELFNGIGSLVDGGIEALDGPIREAANRLTVATRRKRMDLVEEARDTLTLAMLEQKIRAKEGMSGVLDIFLNGGINLLVNGAIAALGAITFAP